MATQRVARHRLARHRVIHTAALRGMTLVELMVVALIMGILAAIAIASYTVYIRHARATEAKTFLAQIGVREEAYRSEFAQYCSAGNMSGSPPTGVGVGVAWPTASPTLGAANWNTAGAPIEWAELGVRPQTAVWFRYVAVGGQPPATPPNEPTYTSGPNQDAWWVAEAYGDLNENGIDSTFHVSSISVGVVITPDETE